MSDKIREAFDAWRSSGSWTRPDDPGEWAAWQAALAQQPATSAVPVAAPTAQDHFQRASMLKDVPVSYAAHTTTPRRAAMSDVNRYFVATKGHCRGTREWVSLKGEIVSATDYDALAQRFRELESEINLLRHALSKQDTNS